MSNYSTWSNGGTASSTTQRVQDVVHPMVHCETCAYQSGDLGPVFTQGELIKHMSQLHWTKVGTKFGQSIYLCQMCQSRVQMSYSPVVDFAGNLMCDITCLRESLRARIEAGQERFLALQQIQDEAYVRESLGAQ